MKKVCFTLVFSLLSFLINAQVIEKTYHFDTPVASQIEGYDQVNFSGCLQSALAGQPSLPWQSISLLLPQGQEASSIEVVLSDFITLEGEYNLYPYQSSRPYSKPERKFIKDESIYASKSTYPETNHGVLTTHFMNGFGFAFSAITPVQYIPSTGKIMYAKTAKVRITTSATKDEKSAMLWATANNISKVEKLAQNPEMLSSYNTRERAVAGYELLIITPAQWTESFSEYQDFYLARGLRSQVASLEDIYASMSGIDNKEKIRNYIIQEYTENGIMMVLLGGDSDLVPYRGFYCDVLTGGNHQIDNNIPADLYYCALDGNWNTNGNDKWGEIGEDDLLPEIGIGRMCFNNQNEFDNMMHKTMNYQTNPVLGEFRKITLGGEHLYDDPVSNGSQYLELLIGERDDNGYTTIGIPEDYNFTRLYEEEGTWSGNALMNTINQGTQYVHHDGHANTNYVAGWYNSSITDDAFSGANGVDHNYTFFHTSGCICGDFSDECILERMTQISNFAVAAIGNSRYGWFNEGQTEGPAIHLHREMEDAYYHERIPYAGLALSESKTQTAPFVNAPGQWEENALRWNFYDINLLGDVAVSPWHDEPFTPVVEYSAELVIGTTSTEVVVKDENGNGLYNFRCSIFNGEEMIGFASTDENGVATINFTPGIEIVSEFSLIVTGSDAWPQTLPIISLPNNSAYVVYDKYEINDQEGNGNGNADFGENISLNMKFKNVGNINSNAITATLSCESQYVNITESSKVIGSINGTSSIEVENAFRMTIEDNVPNGTMAQFTVECTDGESTWTSQFSIRLNAPQFAMLSVTLDDSQGNNNNAADPGETITLHFVLKNTGGADAPNTVFNVYCSFPEFSFTQSQFTQGMIAAGEEFSADFAMTLGEDIQNGVAYEFPVSIYSGNYITEDAFLLSIGHVVEDFETGDFSLFDWTFSGALDWTIDNANQHNGNYCSVSGRVSDNQSSSLIININIANDGEISFYRKISSESTYDKLFFIIDGEEKGNWSGDLGWEMQTYAIAAGPHCLEWKYKKDGSMSSGSDCAWIDDIVFPASEIITEIVEIGGNVSIYPNPNNGTFTISLPNELCEVVIYNSLGQVVSLQSKCMDSTKINIENLESGIYFVNVKSNSTLSTIKFIKK
jgi:conserved repeat domain